MQMPKMVLIGHIVGEDEDAVARAASSESCGCATRDAPKASRRHRRSTPKSPWLDRARTAAIAAHTNAFKMQRLRRCTRSIASRRTDGIERINIELSIGNKLALCDALDEALGAPFPAALWGAHAEELPPPETVAAKLYEARVVIAAARLRWQGLQDSIEESFPALQDHSVVVSWKAEIKAPLEDIFAGIALRPSSSAASIRIAKCCVDACSLHCTCTPATATYTATYR